MVEFMATQKNVIPIGNLLIGRKKSRTSRIAAVGIAGIAILTISGIGRGTIREDDLQFQIGVGSWGVGHPLRGVEGTVTNNSKYNLASFQLGIMLKDCQTSEAKCVIGDEKALVEVSVPTGQTRQFKTAVGFYNAPQTRADQWSFTYYVTDIRAGR
jgi:hypothetical protein